MDESTAIDPENDGEKTVVDRRSLDFSGDSAATLLLTSVGAARSSSFPGSSKPNAKGAPIAWQRWSLPLCLGLALAVVIPMWIHDRQSLNAVRKLGSAAVQCATDPSPSPIIESDAKQLASLSFPEMLAPPNRYVDERRLADLIVANDYEAAAAAIETLLTALPQRSELTDLATALKWTVRCGAGASTRARGCR